MYFTMFDFQTFRPWAKFWIPALVQLIVSGGTGSPGIHYFILDLVATILSWHTVAIPEVGAYVISFHVNCIDNLLIKIVTCRVQLYILTVAIENFWSLTQGFLGFI